MSDKSWIIISTAEKAKAKTGLNYAYRIMSEGWIENVQRIFFGPSQQLLLEDDEMIAMVKQISAVEAPIACKFIADRDGISEQTAAIGVRVEYVGKIISEYIRAGYVPMVFQQGHTNE